MIKSQPSTFKHFCGVLPDKLAPFHGVRVNPEKPGWVSTGWTYFKITRAEKQGPHDCHVAYSSITLRGDRVTRASKLRRQIILKT